MKPTAMLLLFATIALPAAADRRRAVYPSAPPCADAVLATSVQTNDLAVDGDFVYFADYVGGLFRVPRNGGEATRLMPVTDGFFSVALVVDENTIYFIFLDQSTFLASIYSVPKSGGTPSLLAAGVVTPYELAVDQQAVYWISLGTPTQDDEFLADGKVERVGKDGSGRTTLASSLSVPFAIALDGDRVLFSETGMGLGDDSAGLRSVPKSGGAVTTLLDGVPVLAIAPTATDIYVGAFDAQALAGSISALSKSTNTLTRLASDVGLPLNFRIAGNDLYYFFQGQTSDTVRSIPLSGTAPPRIVKETDFATSKFAVDDCALFYATIDLETFDGTLRRSSR